MGRNIKKGVTIHPLVDRIIRKHYSNLIREGYNINYSRALNSLILNLLILVDDNIREMICPSITREHLEEALREVLGENYV